MWCRRCDKQLGGADEPCFIVLAEEKYPNVPACQFWRWIDWLNNRSVDEREYGPGLGADEHALGRNWASEVFEKTENAASRKCLEKIREAKCVNPTLHFLKVSA